MKDLLRGTLEWFQGRSHKPTNSVRFGAALPITKTKGLCQQGIESAEEPGRL